MQTKQKEESNIIGLITFRFLPYWPLFAVMFVFSIAGAWAYLKFTTPLYVASATLMVKDEKKGVDDSKLLDALNIYSSTKIVENEIEVLRSRSIMKEVSKELNLYAPIEEHGNLRTSSAYKSSPILIEVRNPEKITAVDETPFMVNAKGEVVINGKKYAQNKWVKTPFGELRFKPNPKKTRAALNPLTFSLWEVSDISDYYLSMMEVIPASKLSTVINISIKDEVPQRAEDILEKVLEIYHNFSITEKNKLASNTLAFVIDRLRFVEAELDSMERAIQRFKSEKKVTNLSEEGDLYLHSVGENDKKSADISVQLAVLDQIEKYVISKQESSNILPSTLGVTDPVLGQMLQRLRDTELRYQVLRKTVPENNPLALSLYNEVENIRPGILENIRNQKDLLRTSRDELANSTGSYNAQLRTLPVKERQLVDISRQQVIINDVYTFLLHKREETALSYASTVADSWIVNTPQASPLPVSPKKMIIYVIGVLLAIIISGLIVTLKEVVNKKVLFRSEIEQATQVPVAAEILRVKGKNNLLIAQDKNSSIAEQFRQLRSAIGIYGKNTTIKKILVTSSVSGEGKSFISCNLALSLAFSGKKVLLIDLDLRNPSVSFTAKVDDKPGVMEYLQNEITLQDIIHNVLHKNLFVIGAGQETLNPTELLLNGRVDELFDCIDGAFDYVIIDTSPVAPIIDAYVLSGYADSTLFVIRHAFTSKTILHSLDDTNKMKPLKNVSIVFNGIKSRGIMKGKLGFGYGYGYGYEYVYKEQRGINRKKPSVPVGKA